MKHNSVRVIAYAAAAILTMSNVNLVAHAESAADVLPSAGIDFTLGTNTVSLSSLQENEENSKPKTEEAAVSLGDLTASIGDIDLAGLLGGGDTDEKTTETGKKIEDTVIVSRGYTEDLAEAAGTDQDDEEEGFKNLVIAQVHDYVNVRDLPSEEDGEIIGKLYNNSVGNFIEEEDGWYKISSGSVEGYVKGEYCVTGEDAVELAKKVGTRIATVTTTTLKVRESDSTEAPVLGLVPIDDELVVTEELDGWVKVDIEEGAGYVSTDYVTLSTEFVKAESKAEEEARLAKEKAEREAAQKAAAKKASSQSEAPKSETKTYAPAGSASGQAVVDFAKQFVGNPYVYGGTSLTNGADCSGFVMSVYANFGVSLPHSSAADRKVGATVGSLEEAQPGDIVCYSGHVGIYAGNGMLVHASTSKTGIIVSSATYRNILTIRRIF